MPTNKKYLRAAYISDCYSNHICVHLFSEMYFHQPPAIWQDDLCILSVTCNNGDPVCSTLESGFSFENPLYFLFYSYRAVIYRMLSLYLEKFPNSYIKNYLDKLLLLRLLRLQLSLKPMGKTQTKQWWRNPK